MFGVEAVCCESIVAWWLKTWFCLTMMMMTCASVSCYTISGSVKRCLLTSITNTQNLLCVNVGRAGLGEQLLWSLTANFRLTNGNYIFRQATVPLDGDFLSFLNTETWYLLCLHLLFWATKAAINTLVLVFIETWIKETLECGMGSL